MTEERLKEIEARFAQFDGYSGNHILAAFGDAYGDRPVRAVTDDFRDTLSALKEAQQERDALRAENAILREALLPALAVVYGMLPGTGPHSWNGAELREIHNQGHNAFASTPLSEKAAAVLRLSFQLRENELATEQSSGMSEWSLADQQGCLLAEWRAAIDALQKAQEAGEKSGG